MAKSIINQKKPSKISQRLQEYNRLVRYQYRPTGKFSKNMPLIIAPFVASVLSFFFIGVFVAAFSIFNPSFSSIDGETKGRAVTAIVMVMYAPMLFISYIFNFFIMHQIAKRLKFRTTQSGYITKSLSVVAFISALFLFIFISQNNSNNIAYIFVPYCFFTIGFFNTFMYRSFNELYKRDMDGNIIMLNDEEIKNIKTGKSKKSSK